MRCWIFQAVPREYDIAARMQDTTEEDWRVTRYFRKIKKGDVVYFWQAGKSGGLCGWGHVQSEEPYTTPDGNYRANVTYEVRFDELIPRDVVRATNHLEKMHVIKVPEGTNFKVTRTEAGEINRLIAEAGYDAPSLEEAEDE